MNFGSWRKSSYSGENGSCVEVAFANPVVGIRDSKNVGSRHLTVEPAAWTAFLATAKGQLSAR